MRPDEFINLALERTKARVRVNDLVTGLLALLAFVLVYLLAVIVADQSFQFSRTARLWLLAALGAVGLAGLVLILLWPSLRRVNDLFAARLIERQAEDQFRNSLVTCVQARGDDRLGPEVRAAIEAKAARDLDQIDVDLAVNRRPLHVAVAALLAALAVTLGFALMSRRDFGTSLYRALGADVPPPTSTRIVLVRTDPDAPTVMAGTSLRIIAVTADRQPDNVELGLTRGGIADKAVAMREVDVGTWEAVVENLMEDLDFEVRAGDARSSGHHVGVLPLPAIVDVRTVLTHPAYTLRPPETCSTGNVEALPGTCVEVVARTNQPPQRPEMVFGDGSRRVSMQTGREVAEARGTFTVEGAQTYHIQFYDATLRHTNAGAVRYQVTPLADQPPEVALDRAGTEVHVPVGGKVALDVRARDDVGLAALAAHWQKVQPGAAEEANPVDAANAAQAATPPAQAVLVAVPDGKAVAAIDDQFSLEVAAMGLAEGDHALVWVSASDRLPGSPQHGRSAPIRVVIDPPGKGGSGGDSPEQQSGSTAGTGGGTSSERKTAGLSPDERSQLEQFERAARQSQGQPQAQPGGQGDGASSSAQQPAGTGADPAQGRPTPGDNTGGDGTGAGDSQPPNPVGNPAEGVSPQPPQRDPDQEPDARHAAFDESGRRDGPAGEAQLLRAVGPQIRRVAQELRRGTVDEALLKELGWNETELRQFVRAWQDDDRFDRAAAAQGASPS
ncbi:MAG TPA: hypothetical protein PLP01_02500, partial [Phycisphaerae bacterium]|nr:hypothetical protein [Phycisphaerae bacterium]